MGNFHCISEGCAEVVYRPYESARVRWRYPGEEWQEIEADDYTIENLPGQCCNSYDVTVSYKIVKCNGDIYYTGTATVRIPNAVYQSVDYLLTTGFIKTHIVVKYFDCVQNKHKEKSVWGSSAKSSFDYPCLINDATYSKGLSKWELIDLVRADGQPDECKTCKFTIFKNGKIVHQEEREDCPKVEQLPCRLSDVSKEIKVEKFAYFEKIEVIPFAYSQGSVIQAKSIPEECLNIYVNNLILLNNANSAPSTNVSFERFKGQICSAENCPPPEYEVICDCNNECPEGTCEILCGGYICCVDPITGDSVKSIPVDEFLPTGLSDSSGVR